MNFSLSGGWGTPDSIELLDGQSIRLHWDRSLMPNSTYILTPGVLTDPCGNQLMDENIEISWIIPQKGDVVINEILFNPWPGGSDFVEIYNRSAKNIPLNKLCLATRDASGQLKNLDVFCKDRTVIEPGGCLAVTEDTAGICAFYKTPCRECIRKAPSLPPFNNDEGTVVLLSDSLYVLDEFPYSEEMHHPLIYDPEGVSLERIHPENPAGDHSNWQSASSDAGFATPGFRNSQYLKGAVKRTTVIFEQTSFSPNNDGFNDELIIRYETRTSGWTGNCRVFDLYGREVLYLLNNETLSTSGKITWTGIDAHGKKLPVGPYVVLFEAFDLFGHIEKCQKAVILTERGVR